MADIKDSKNWGFETRQLHIGQEQADPVTDARAVPIYASTSYAVSYTHLCNCMTYFYCAPLQSCRRLYQLGD